MNNHLSVRKVARNRPQNALLIASSGPQDFLVLRTIADTLRGVKGNRYLYLTPRSQFFPGVLTRVAGFMPE